MADAVKVTGLEDLKRAVDELSADMRKKVVIGALKDAAKPIVAAARAAAPVLKTPDPRRTPGLIRDRIGVFTSKIFKGQDGVLGVMVRVKQNKGKRIRGTKIKVRALQQDPFYARFLEVGTRNMTARSFLQPAANQNFAAAVEIFKKKIAERIAKANKRTKSK